MQDSKSKDSALKVAIIRLSSLGDIVSTIVFLDLLRTKFAQQGRKIDISFIVDSQFRGILENSPLVDKIIDLPLRKSKKDKKLIFSVIKKTRQLGHFDKVIDAQGLLKSALIGKMLKKNEFIGYDKDSIREKIASFFYTKKATIAYNEHILKRQYELFRVAFDEVAWEGDFRLEMLDSRNRAMDSSPKAKAKIAQILAPHEANKKILFLCETSKADKEFSLDSFFALSQGLWSDYKEATIFLIWDKKESEIRALGDKDSRFCVLPHLDFDEIKALLARVDLVIGGDTGITHSAWVMKVPSVTIYVSTDIKRFALGGEKHFSILVGNSSLGASCEDLANFECSQTTSLVSHSKFAKNSTTSTANTRIYDLNQGDSSKSNDSSLRGESMDSPKQSKQNNLHEVQTESRQIRGAKNRIQTSSSASADFLLESELRGSPPKSEKRQLLARRGSGAGGAALLRKETNETKSKKIVGDSQVTKMDSSLTESLKNDDRVDCHYFATQNLAMTGGDSSLRGARSATKQSTNQKIDCFGQSPCNDDISVNCHESTFVNSRNDKSNADSTQIAQISQIIAFAKKVLQ